MVLLTLLQAADRHAANRIQEEACRGVKGHKKAISPSAKPSPKDALAGVRRPTLPAAFQPRANHRKPQPIHNHNPTTRNGRDTIRDTVAKDYCAVGLLRHDNVVTDYAFAGVGCAGCEGESGVVERQTVHMADVEAVG